MMLMNHYPLNLKLRVLSHCPIVSGMSHLGHRGTLATLQRSHAETPRCLGIAREDRCVFALLSSVYTQKWQPKYNPTATICALSSGKALKV